MTCSGDDPLTLRQAQGERPFDRLREYVGPHPSTSSRDDLLKGCPLTLRQAQGERPFDRLREYVGPHPSTSSRDDLLRG